MIIRNVVRRARPWPVLVALLVVASAAAFAQDPVAEARARTRTAPEDARAWVALGNALLDAEDADAARDAFLEAVAVDYRSCDGHYGVGLAEFERGDPQAALFAFEEVARLCEERFDGHYNRAVALARLDRPEEAAAAFRTAIDEADPEASPADRIAAWTGLAGQRERTGDFAAAAEAYESALTIRPTDDDLIFRRADALWRAGRGLEALPELTDLEGRSDDHRVSALIADVYVDEGQVERAQRTLERALDEARRRGDAEAQASLLVRLGRLHRSLGRGADALDAFRRASVVDEGRWEALYHLGTGLLEAGRTDEAVTTLESADAAAPEGEAAVALALAGAYEAAGRPAEAAEAATRAADAAEEGSELAVEARFAAGRNAYRVGDHGRARDLLESVVEARPNDAAAQLWTGLAAYGQGDYAAAIAYYRRAVEIDPDDVAARANLGAALLATERYEEAENVYELLIEQDAQDAESHYNLGWSLVGQARRGAARDAWASACDMGYGPACDALTRYF